MNMYVLGYLRYQILTKFDRDRNTSSLLIVEQCVRFPVWLLFCQLMWNASLNNRFVLSYLDAYISRLWWYNRCDAIMTVEHLHTVHAPISHYRVQNESKLKSMIHILCSVMTRTSLGHQNKTNNVIFERVHSRLVHVRL